MVQITRTPVWNDNTLDTYTVGVEGIYVNILRGASVWIISCPCIGMNYVDTGLPIATNIDEVRDVSIKVVTKQLMEIANKFSYA